MAPVIEKGASAFLLKPLFILDRDVSFTRGRDRIWYYGDAIRSRSDNSSRTDISRGAKVNRFDVAESR